MDSAEFRAWLGSELAAQQLKAALAEGKREDEEICTQCEEPIASDEHFSYYGILDDMGPLCCWCGRVIAGID